MTRENVTVYYNGPVQTRAETVMDASVETLRNMGRLLETSLTRNFNIVMYNNPVHEWLGCSHLSGGPLQRPGDSRTGPRKEGASDKRFR